MGTLYKRDGMADNYLFRMDMSFEMDAVRKYNVSVN